MGFYARLSAGAAFDDSRLTYPGTSEDVSHSASSGLLGGQIGYNYQVNSLVLGAEVEATWTALNRSGPCGNPIFICSTRDDWVAAATARAGYAFGQALFYGKGGVAFTSFDDHGDDDADPALNERNSASRTGWTLGAGLEYALSPHWSALVEYDHYDFGNVKLRSYRAETGAFVNLVDVDQTMNLVSGGIRYKF